MTPGKLEGEKFFHRISGLCEIIANTCTVSCIVSLGSITLMGFSRYIFICHNKYYKTIFRKSTCIAMCVGLYLIGILLILLNFAGLGGHSFDRKSLVCIWDRMATYYFTVTFSVVLVWIPVLSTGLFYFLIYLTFRKSNMAVTDMTSQNLQRKSVGFVRTLFLIYAVFTICWVPYALIIVADRYDSFSHEIHVIITTFAHLHPSFNWLVYYLTNKNFKHAFNSLLHLNKCCVKKARIIQIVPILK